MAVIEESVVLHCDPEEAFAALSDHTRALQWNPEAIAVEPLTDGPVGVGSSYRTTWRHGGRVVSTITQFDPPRHWVERVSGRIESVTAYNVHQAYDGTRLTSVLSARAHGLAHLRMPFYLHRMRRHQRDLVEALRLALDHEQN